jgi:hypothetical protein
MILILVSSAAVLALTKIWCRAGLSANLRRTGGLTDDLPSVARHIIIIERYGGNDWPQVRAQQRIVRGVVRRVDTQ